MKRQLTLKEVRAGHTRAKRDEDMREPIVFFVTRPLSFPIAWAALRIGMTPNQVSTISVLTNLAGLLLLASGKQERMGQPNTPLAVELLMLYWSGKNVGDIGAITGLSEPAIINRLCAASQSLRQSEWTVLDAEGSLGVQWEFVCLRG